MSFRSLLKLPWSGKIFPPSLNFSKIEKTLAYNWFKKSMKVRVCHKMIPVDPTKINSTKT